MDSGFRRNDGHGVLGSAQDGFSLFEILIAVAIAAMVTALGVNAARGRFEAEVRRVTNRLNGAIHFLYNKAATESKAYRLAIDLEKQTYWVEVAEGSFLIKSEGDEKREKKKIVKKEEKASVSEPETGDEEGEGAEGEPKEQKTFEKPTETSFGPAPNLPRALAQPVSMPRKVVIREVFTGQRKGSTSEGMAYIHFFPQGYAEASIINLSNPDGDKYVALEINPITGFVKVYHERREKK